MRTKHGLKALGLCLLAALSLMAVTAAGAQAKGDWRIAGAKFTGSNGVKGELQEGKDAILLSSVGKTNTPIAILCTTLTTSEATISGEGNSLAKLEFTNCTTTLGGAPSDPCLPEEPITATAKDLLILHNGKTYDLFSPDTGTTFTTIKFPGAECSISGGKAGLPIEGSLVAQCLWKNGAITEIGCEHEEAIHLIEQAPKELFTDKLSFGAHEATLDGAVNLSLLIPNAGKEWSGLGL